MGIRDVYLCTFNSCKNYRKSKKGKNTYNVFIFLIENYFQILNTKKKNNLIFLNIINFSIFSLAYVSVFEIYLNTSTLFIMPPTIVGKVY